tara:strand:- start:4427 stop:5458 length:1032 start_codon:yes stop_codon:yes gene_type:complete
MKSLQDNYNLIKEGKGSKELFLKQVRREFPQYISNVNTFNQVTANLKTRGIISETLSSDLTSKNTEPNWFNIFKENINEAKATEKKVTKEVKDLEEKNFDYKDTANADNLIGAEILTGFYAEMKDPKNLEKTVEEVRAIVIKNLSKDTLYYVKDGQFGVKGLGYTEAEQKEAKGKHKASGYGDITEGIAKEERESDKFGAEVVVRNTVDLPPHIIDRIEVPMEHLGEYEGDDGSIFADLKNSKGEPVRIYYSRLDTYDKEALKEEEVKVEIITKKWPYVEFKDGETLHKVEFEYGDMIDDHDNEGQDQYWVGADEEGQEFELEVYADYQGNVQDVHYDTITRV